MTNKLTTEIEWHRYPEVKPKTGAYYQTNKGREYYGGSGAWLRAGITLWAENPIAPVIEDKVIDLNCLIGSDVPLLFATPQNKRFVSPEVLEFYAGKHNCFDPNHWVSNRGENPWPRGLLVDVEYRSSDIDRSFGANPRYCTWGIKHIPSDIIASKPSVDEDGNVLLEPGYRMP